jgi:NTP pyrophosphatase (non-canonical NTP hydrolase)
MRSHRVHRYRARRLDDGEPVSRLHAATLADLESEVRAFCEERDWDRFHDAKNLAIGIATEAGELLQLFRFLTPEQVGESLANADSRMMIEEELADVAIFVLRFSGRHGVDLAAAIRRKLALNAARYPIETSRGSNRKAGG